MSPFDLNQVSSTISIGEGDQDQTVRPFFAVANDSSFSSPVLFRNPHDHGADARGYLLPQQLLQQGQNPKDHPVKGNESSGHWGDQDTNNKIKLTWCKKFAEEQEHEGAGQWMSSKMRIMKKMMSSEESKPTELNTHVTDEQNHFSSSIKPPNGLIRVCSDCNTTKTPLWRGGPRGPKSLCNACGIRQRKARRAMEATAAMSGAIYSDAPTKIRKEKKPDNKHHTAAAPFKKRCKITTASSAPRKQLGFEDCKIGLSTTNSAFHEVFPQDERDAAILLMALSCGLIRS